MIQHLASCNDQDSHNYLASYVLVTIVTWRLSFIFRSACMHLYVNNFADSKNFKPFSVWLMLLLWIGQLTVQVDLNWHVLQLSLTLHSNVWHLISNHDIVADMTVTMCLNVAWINLIGTLSTCTACYAPEICITL